MIDKKTRFIFAAFVLLLGALFSDTCVSEVIDKVVVVVNDEIITRSEINQKLTPIYARYASTYDEQEAKEKLTVAYSDILERLVDDKLVISEAKRKGVSVTDDEVRSEIDFVKKRFDSEEEYYMTLETQGISLNEIKDNYRSSLMAKKLIEDEIGTRVSVTPSEMMEFYTAHKNEFIQPETVRANTILIRRKPDRNNAESLALAESMLERLNNGEDFSSLARKYSEGTNAPLGGDMGYIRKGDMVSQIDDAVFNLDEGRISKVIESTLGYHIFMVREKLKPQPLSFHDVKSQIESRLFNEEVSRRLKAYIGDLRKKSYIAYK